MIGIGKNTIKTVEYETNPCEECDYARAFCDYDFESCQLHGRPLSDEEHYKMIEREDLRFSFGNL